MLLDARELPDATVLNADICIVGAGAAGISVALALRNSGLDVVLLEAGGIGDEAESQALYKGEVVDTRLHSPLDRYRQRRLGGSTTIWGGRCMPFDAIDFEPRDYIAHSGWPIRLSDLQPFYPMANRLCEAGDDAYTVQATFGDTPLRPMIEGFASEHFSTDGLERFSCPTDFGVRYRRMLETAPRVQLIYHANLTALDMNGSKTRIVSARARTLNGKSLTVMARDVVLAAGGLENVRLLLNSPGPSGAGIGNTHDAVGRYYMCHLAGTIGTLSMAPGRRGWHGYDVSEDGVYCRRRLALTAAAQHRLHTGNFIARLHHPRIPDPLHQTGVLSLLYLARFVIPYEYGKRLHGGERVGPASILAHVRNVVCDAPAIAGFLSHWVRKRTLAARKFPSIIVHPKVERYSLDFHAEQEPNAQSRVMLAEELDALGMRRLRVDWRYSPQDIETVQAALAAFAADMKSSGAGVFAYDPQEVEGEMTRYGAYGGHHIGTTRMGTDPASSVVDRNCKVHDLDNLYVCGASVFPTSSQANPTLTIIALALRLATHLTGCTPKCVELSGMEPGERT